MFSINYYSYVDSSQTYIYFGGYESSYASSDDDIVWFDLTGSGFWEIDGGKVYYGKDSNDSLGTLGNAIIDTGSSIAYIDYSIIDKIVEASGKDCVINSGLYECSCTSADNFDDLYFGFGNENDDPYTKVQVNNDNYILYESGTCFILLADGSETLLGDAFLRDIYIIHDVD